MNDHDKNNLEFIINTINSGNWKTWVEGLSSDEIYYALELVTSYHSQLELEHLEDLDDIRDVSQARELLSKF